MHRLYIHQYFSTPLGCAGLRSYEFAHRWVAKGHQVAMLTSTAQLFPGDSAGTTGKILKKMSIDGIDVLALIIPYQSKKPSRHNNLTQLENFYYQIKQASANPTYRKKRLIDVSVSNKIKGDIL